MKKIKFIKSFCIIFIFTMLSVCPITVIPAQASSCSSQNYNSGNDTIQPHAAIIEWVHKEVNGKVYRRLYNHQTKKWIGDWILCN